MTKFTLLAVAVGVLAWAAPARAAEKVELKSVHMCCPGCAETVEKILSKVPGVTGVDVDQEARTAKFAATDAKAAQKALDALVAEGFYGDTGGAKGYAFKADSGVKPGKVKSLTVTDFHNTCPGCAKAFKAAIKDVKGVTGDNVKPRVTTCEVTGDFDAAELVKALNKAGFYVKVK
jgi:copper chaperone CopZ